MPALIDGIGTVAAIKKLSSTSPTTTTSSGQTAYETRTGDLGNVVSPNPPAPNPTITAPTQPTVTSVPTQPVQEPVVQTPTVTEQPEVVAQEQPAAAQPSIGDATAFNPAVLQQILTALEAQYGLSKEQLLADQSEVGRLYRFINQNLGRMETAALAGGVEASLGRGILRSGIHLQNQAEVERDFAERRASAEGEQAQQLTYINNQLAALEAQKQAEIQAAAQGFGQQGLDYASQFAASGAFAPTPEQQAAAVAQAAGATPFPVQGTMNPTVLDPRFNPELLIQLANVR